MAKERILVVDDERNIVELIKYNLEKEGYEVICAYDGIEAVNIAKQDRPDLIILDIMLPGQGGLEVTRILQHEVRKNGQEVELKPKEFDLLKLMSTNPGKVFTRDFLLEQLWGYDYLGDTRTVDVHMRRLRQKIEDQPSSPVLLKTVHGIGYKFQYEEPK